LIIVFLSLPTVAFAVHKPIYVEEFGFTGRPDLAGLYSIGTMHVIGRGTHGGATYWTDATALPDGDGSAWYDNAASWVTTNGWTIFYVDHESWLVSTQAQRLATAQKIVTMYNALKARLPTVTIGFYGGQFTPVRDVSGSCRCLLAHDDANYLAWQAENTDFAAVYAVVDMIMPTLYWFETRATDGGASVTYAKYHTFATENLAEARRMRATYGHGQPIITWVWFRRHDDAADLDPEVWEDIIRVAMQQGDGMVVFTLSKAWSETYSWWVTMKIQLGNPYPWGDRTLTQARSVRP
jgi:hypothetical protein